MNRSMQELGIDCLSVADRIALAQEIWESIAKSVQSLAPNALEIAELDRRLAEDDSTPSATSAPPPWSPATSTSPPGGS